MINKIFGNNSEETEEETDEQTEEQNLSTPEVPDANRNNRDVIAPSLFDENVSYVRSDGRYIRVLFIESWPEEPDPMFLNSILYGLQVDMDVSIHVSPRDKQKAMDELDAKLESSKTQLNKGFRQSTQERRQKRFQDTKRTYEGLKNQNLHEISMYITIRADSEEELNLMTEEVVNELRTNELIPENPRNDQVRALKSASPINNDVYNRKTPALSASVGRMYPFGSSTIQEKGGVDIGFHDINNAPVTIRRFDRQNGYNQITPGKIGTGKTYGSIIELLRFKAAYGDDLTLFLIDPLGDYKIVNEILGGEEVLVGGNTSINPMRIDPTPEKAFEQNPDLDPYKQKKEQLIDFIGMLYEEKDMTLGEHRSALSIAIDKTYEKAGITSDPDTHDNESPTLRDLRETLKEMEKNPEEFVNIDNPENSEITSNLRSQSSDLYLALNEFSENGKYRQLGRKGSIDMSENSLTYFNLQQVEGSGSNLGLMMYLILTEVYDEVKSRDENVLFYIDEAHYIMQDAQSLDYLETVVRHSRHYNLGINFITQTIDEFFDHPKARDIVQQISIKKLHRIEAELSDDIRKALGLNDAHMNYIRKAETGDKGYSQTLYKVGQNDYVPVKIIPSDFEDNVYTEYKERLDV